MSLLNVNEIRRRGCGLRKERQPGWPMNILASYNNPIHFDYVNMGMKTLLALQTHYKSRLTFSRKLTRILRLRNRNPSWLVILEKRIMPNALFANTSQAYIRGRPEKAQGQKTPLSNYRCRSPPHGYPFLAVAIEKLLKGLMCHGGSVILSVRNV